MWVESEFSFSPFALISVPDRLSPVACPSSPADDCSAPGAREQRATHANTGPNLLRSHLIKRAGELPAGPYSQVGWDFFCRHSNPLYLPISQETRLNTEPIARAIGTNSRGSFLFCSASMLELHRSGLWAIFRRTLHFETKIKIPPSKDALVSEAFK